MAWYMVRVSPLSVEQPQPRSCRWSVAVVAKRAACIVDDSQPSARVFYDVYLEELSVLWEKAEQLSDPRPAVAARACLFDIAECYPDGRGLQIAAPRDARDQRLRGAGRSGCAVRLTVFSIPPRPAARQRGCTERSSPPTPPSTYSRRPALFQLLDGWSRTPTSGWYSLHLFESDRSRRLPPSLANLRSADVVEDPQLMHVARRVGYRWGCSSSQKLHNALSVVHAVVDR